MTEYSWIKLKFITLTISLDAIVIRWIRVWADFHERIPMEELFEAVTEFIGKMKEIYLYGNSCTFTLLCQVTSRH